MSNTMSPIGEASSQSTVKPNNNLLRASILAAAILSGCASGPKKCEEPVVAPVKLATETPKPKIGESNSAPTKQEPAKTVAPVKPATETPKPKIGESNSTPTKQEPAKTLVSVKPTGENTNSGIKGDSSKLREDLLELEKALEECRKAEQVQAEQKPKIGESNSTPTKQEPAVKPAVQETEISKNPFFNISKTLDENINQIIDEANDIYVLLLEDPNFKLKINALMALLIALIVLTISGNKAEKNKEIQDLITLLASNNEVKTKIDLIIKLLSEKNGLDKNYLLALLMELRKIENNSGNKSVEGQIKDTRGDFIVIIKGDNNETVVNSGEQDIRM